MLTEGSPKTRNRWWSLLILCAGQLMIILDGSIVTVAMPAIQRELGFTQSALAWVVNAYLIAFGGLLLLAGRLGDLIGRRRMFVAGLIVFTAASLLCGVAPSQEMLIVARFLQGAGGAMASAVVLGMVVTMFPEPKEQAKAIGVVSFVSASGASIGLLAGGVLTDAISWNWIFFINVPIGVAATVLALTFDKDRGIGFGKGADIIGAVLVTGGLMLLVYAIVETNPVLLAAAVALIAAFLVRQAKAATPLLPLRIFRSRAVSGANVVQMLMVAGLFGFQFLGALYLQQVLHYDALRTGLAYLPVTVAIALVSLFVAPKLKPAVALPGGLVGITVALLLLTQAPVNGQYLVHVLPVMILLGIGGGMAMPAVMGQAMSGATPEDSGLASGLVNTTQQVGGAVGLAVLSTFAASRTESELANGTANVEALNSGFHLAFGVSAGFVVAAIVVALTVLRRSRKPELALAG
ncbi:MFS transporter [Kibdelosporangium aridum]|uniref:Drug resistance transporter, EmrB/QacA subfamily n=1 Tax=Kibdelosporangium aridum TaxID=2030 RepID=A0A1W2FRP3_KIBAR|nr:MFS transporter [Kibdelosporangium aridum]SMD24444.1 drug resistance transporter, EmrB/QacA subfamily [Kibdelosporangium aridum]